MNIDRTSLKKSKIRVKHEITWHFIENKYINRKLKRYGNSVSQAPVILSCKGLIFKDVKSSYHLFLNAIVVQQNNFYFKQ